MLLSVSSRVVHSFCGLAATYLARSQTTLSESLKPVEGIFPTGCEVVHTCSCSFSPNNRVWRRAMTEPPWWLTIDVSVIVMSAIIIGIGAWIGLM